MKQKVEDKSLCVTVLYLEYTFPNAFLFGVLVHGGVDKLKYAKIFPLSWSKGERVLKHNVSFRQWRHVSHIFLCKFVLFGSQIKYLHYKKLPIKLVFRVLTSAFS